jgi:hypothetical protein
MTWSINLPHLSAAHTSGLKVHLVPNGKSKYFFQVVEGTKHHLDNVPTKTACNAEWGAPLMRLLKQRH